MYSISKRTARGHAPLLTDFASWQYLVGSVLKYKHVPMVVSEKKLQGRQKGGYTSVDDVKSEPVRRDIPEQS